MSKTIYGNTISSSTGVSWRLRVTYDTVETDAAVTCSYQLSLGATSSDPDVKSWTLRSSQLDYSVTCGGSIESGSFPSSSRSINLLKDVWGYTTITSGSFTKAKSKSGSKTYQFTGSLEDSLKSEAKFSLSVPGLEQHTVTFRKRDGSTYMTNTVYYGETVSKPTNPTERGYTFSDWYTDSGLTNKASFPYRVTKDQIMYSAWSLTSKVYAKVNGSWVQIPKPMAKDSNGVWKECDVYVKVNGSWVKLN